MKKLVIVIMAIALLASAAFAGKPVLDKPVAPLNPAKADFVHDEYGDTCADEAWANIIAADGLTFEGDLQANEEVDWFEVFVPTAGTFVIQTGPGDALPTDDTQMTLYSGDCDGDALVEIEFDDDDGDGYFSLLELALDAGTYYLSVNLYPYSTPHPGTYTVIMEELVVVPPPVNDVCEGAIDLQTQGMQMFDVDLSEGYTDASTLASGSCTGYTAPGPDAFYSINLAAGTELVVTEAGDCDMAMYLVTDCSDPFTYCVAGADSGSPEILTYTVETAGVYYLVVDTYTGAGCPVTVTVDGVVATESANWGSLKTMYR